MTGINDWSELGIFPLQDHDSRIPVETRLQMVGARISRMEDPGSGQSSPASSMVEYARESGKGTLGDIHPWSFWQTADRGVRGSGSWSMAWASTVIGTGTGNGIRVLPFADFKFRPDGRYIAKNLARPGCFQAYPKGYHTLCMPATYERFQHDLMLSADPRLVAVNANAPGNAGTLVVDLQPTNELCMSGSDQPGIGGRHARLQSMMRVIPLRKGGIPVLGTRDGNGIAWQLADSEQDGILGFGLVFSRVEGAATTQGTRPPQQRNTKGNTACDIGDFAPKKRGGHGCSLMAQLGGAGPYHGGHANDKHLIAADMDGHPINAGHLSTNAYFYRSQEQDAPLFFEGEYPNTTESEIPVKVHLSYDAGHVHPFLDNVRPGMWKWWTKVPYMEPRTPGGTRPPVQTRNPGGGPPSPGGPTTPGPTGPAPTGPGPRRGGQTPGGTRPPSPGGPTPRPPGPRTPGGAPPAPPTGGPRTPGPRDTVPPQTKWSAPTTHWWEAAKQPPPRVPPRPPPQGQPQPFLPGDGLPDENPTIGPQRFGGEPRRPPQPPPTPDDRRALGVRRTVGETNREDVGLWSIHHPMRESFAAMAFRPQLWVDGFNNYSSNPDTSPGEFYDDEAVRPNVMSVHTWGTQTGAGEWGYTEGPQESRARGGTVDGGVLLTPPHLEMEDYFGIRSTVDVDDASTTSWFTAASNVGFALGAPNTDGGLIAGSVLIDRDATSSDYPLRVQQLNSSRVAVPLIEADVSQAGDGVTILLDSGGNGQVAVGTASPSASAVLDLTSTTLGFLPPRMTTTQRDAITGVAGLVIYNTTTSKLNVYTSAWEEISSATP